MDKIVEDSILVNINSADGIYQNGTMKSFVNFNIEGLLIDEPNILYSELQMINASFTLSNYTINSQNNTLYYIYNGIVYNFNIPVGNYTSSDLVNQLQNSFSSNNTNLIVNYSENTGLLTFQSSLYNFTLYSSYTRIFVSSINNVLKYKYAGSSVIKSLTVPISNTDASTFIDTISNLLKDNGSGFFLSIDFSTGEYVFESTSTDFTFLSSSTISTLLGFSGEVHSQNLILRLPIILNSNPTTITNILGIGNSAQASTNKSLTLPCQLNLMGLTQIKICSDLISTDNYDSRIDNLIAVVYVNAPNYGIQNYQFNYHKNLLKNRYLNNIDIQLTDQNNNYIDFQNIDWSITFRIIKHRFLTLGPTNLYDYLLKYKNNTENNIEENNI